VDVPAREMEFEEEGLTCHTAPGVAFATMDELKAHYRSDWHRYNLKRKVAGLPVVGKELFERVMAQAGADQRGGGRRETGRDHLKRPDELPRSVQRARRMEEWAEHHKDEIAAAQAAQAELERRVAAGEDVSDLLDASRDDDDDRVDLEEEARDRFDVDDEEDDDASDDASSSGWESMDDDEAREVLERMDRMAAEGASSGDSDADSEDEMELDLTDAPVRLAENGYELLVTRDDSTRVRIGPRELRRYYKQRPRPDDDRAMVLAARANEEARGMARLGETRAGERGLAAFDASGKFSLPHISIMVKRAQKAARKYERNNMFQGNSSIKKFDLNGQNVKVKLPKACPY